MFFRVKVIIEYNGKYFHGWQKQIENQNVQGFIEEALKKIFQKNVDIFAAGRTDAGVHALAQVAHFDLNFQDLKKFFKNDFCYETVRYKICLALNSLLFNQYISILDVEILNLNHSYKENDEDNQKELLENLNSLKNSMHNYEDDALLDFHARFSAKEKTYIYKIINKKQPPAIDKDFFWHISQEIFLINHLQEISSVLKGRHDFSAFRSKFCQSNKPIRTINEIDVNVQKKNSWIFENEIHFTFKAKAFLHHQIRFMVGTIIQISKKKISLNEAKNLLKNLLDNKQKNPIIHKAPAHGLYLAKIDY